jgi:predicted Zn-dependent peptidase
MKSIVTISAILMCAACAAAVKEPSTSSPVSRIQIVSEQLPSGYRVVVARTPPVAGREPRIYVGSYVLHGSIQETRSGIAHFMEHVVANNRSTIAGPARPEGAKFFDANALTRPYYTSFVTVVPSALLASTVHSRMARMGRVENDSQVFVTEKGRVLAEVERDMSGKYPAYKALVALALGKSPRIADELDIVRNTNSEELARTIAPIYRPHDAVFVVAGDLDIDSTLALVRATDARLKLAEIRSGSKAANQNPKLRMGMTEVITGQNRSNQTIVAVGWEKPALGQTDQIPVLIADQLLLGRGSDVDDPVRSNDSPLAVRLARSLGGSAFGDGRSSKWQAPEIIDTGPSIHAVVFATDRIVTVEEVRDSVIAALRDIKQNAMNDAMIGAAKESLASFYERWFFEPTYRILGDHLMAYVATGRDPNNVKLIPTQIRRVRAGAVRDAFDRYFLQAPANIVILPPAAGP